MDGTVISIAADEQVCRSRKGDPLPQVMHLLDERFRDPEMVRNRWDFALGLTLGLTKASWNE